MKLTSSLTLSKYTAVDKATGKVLTEGQTDKLFKDLLTEAGARQNKIIKRNSKTDCLKKTSYSNTAARKLSTPKLPKKYSQQFLTLEMDRSEAWRLLAGWQTRLAVAKLLEAHKWQADYATLKKAWGKKLDFELYKNLQRAKALPTLPTVKNPRLVTSKTHKQYCTVSLKGNKLVYEQVVFDKWLVLEFDLPQKLLQRHPHIIKVCRPTLRLDTVSNKVFFDFAVEEDVVEALGPAEPASVLAVDPGLARAFVAARVYADGRYSEPLVQSVHSDRHEAAIEKFTGEILKLSRKNKQRALLGISKPRALEEEAVLRGKRARARKELAWSVASDVLAHAEPGELVSLEKNRFNTGGSYGEQRWNVGEVRRALDHKARKASQPLEEYSAKNASHTCPKCGLYCTPDEISRVLSCPDRACAWAEDRDYSSAVEGGLRVLRKKQAKGVKPLRARPVVSRQKHKPTPKRPRVARRRSQWRPKSFKKQGWTAFTGVGLAKASGGLGAFGASSAATLVPGSVLVPEEQDFSPGSLPGANKF